MRLVLALLSILFSMAATAEPIHRCKDELGHISIQNRPCRPTARLASADAASFEAQEYKPLYQQYPLQSEVLKRRRSATAPLRSAPVNTAAYAESRSRCENAMRVAALCGRHAGRFICDEKGFRPAPVTGAESSRRALPANNTAFSSDLCAMQASN